MNEHKVHEQQGGASVLAKASGLDAETRCNVHLVAWEGRATPLSKSFDQQGQLHITIVSCVQTGTSQKLLAAWSPDVIPDDSAGSIVGNKGIDGSTRVDG